MSKVNKTKTIRHRPKNLSVTLPAKKKKETLEYEQDFYKWTIDQSKFLKKKEFSKLDIDNLIEEIESLGRSERRALESYFKVLLIHLLKIKYQPDYRTRSWDNSIKVSRYQINKLLKQNPKLKRELNVIIKDAYYLARLEAAIETSIDESIFPKECPWTVEECLDENFPPAKEEEVKQKHKNTPGKKKSF